MNDMKYMPYCAMQIYLVIDNEQEMFSTLYRPEGPCNKLDPFGENFYFIIRKGNWKKSHIRRVCESSDDWNPN